jgi:3-oxocholest-4-en-26-oyl-CoA dehydrogenase beta subunit
MDFGLDERQVAVRDLARQVLGQLYPARSAAAFAPEREPAAWRALGGADLLGVGLPAAVGGSDSGFVALCLLLEQAGEVACPLPLISALVLAGLPIAQADSRRASELLEPLCRGELQLCGSFGSRGEPALRARRAQGQGRGWILNGSESCVEGLPTAEVLLLAARTEEDSLGLFLLEPRMPGVRIEAQSVASGHGVGRFQLQDVSLDANALLCELGRVDALVAWTLERAYLAQSAYELGIAARALALTAQFASERKQFGRPIGTFQAVAQRLGDAHIAVETMRLTLWRAAWLVDSGADARSETAVARMIAARAGHQVVCAAQHVHGSAGFDRDYPLHRYYLASKHNALMLGGEGFHLARLGKLLA